MKVPKAYLWMKTRGLSVHAGDPFPDHHHPLNMYYGGCEKPIKDLLDVNRSSVQSCLGGILRLKLQHMTSLGFRRPPRGLQKALVAFWPNLKNNILKITELLKINPMVWQPHTLVKKTHFMHATHWWCASYTGLDCCKGDLTADGWKPNGKACTFLPTSRLLPPLAGVQQGEVGDGEWARQGDRIGKPAPPISYPPSWAWSCGLI